MSFDDSPLKKGGGKEAGDEPCPQLLAAGHEEHWLSVRD